MKTYKLKKSGVSGDYGVSFTPGKRYALIGKVDKDDATGRFIDDTGEPEWEQMCCFKNKKIIKGV